MLMEARMEVVAVLDTGSTNLRNPLGLMGCSFSFSSILKMRSTLAVVFFLSIIAFSYANSFSSNSNALRLLQRPGLSNVVRAGGGVVPKPDGTFCDVCVSSAHFQLGTDR